jgi:formate hydrogenlyase subunit 3/multisubunit Na+/H+ antiporter MnhD subunit
VLVGVALGTPDLAQAAMAAALVYAVMHSLAKGSLFLAVPVWRAAGSRSRRILTLAGVAVAALTLTGVPPLGGFIAKYGLKAVAESAGISVVMLSLGAAGTTLLMTRFVLTLLATPVDTPRHMTVVEGGWLMLILIGPVMTWWTALQWGAPMPITWTGAWADMWTQRSLSAVLAASWPVLGALVMALAAFHTRHRWLAHLHVPEGDVVVVVEPAAIRVLYRLESAGALPGVVARHMSAHAESWPGRVTALGNRLTFTGWASLGPLALIMLFVLAVTLL